MRQGVELTQTKHFDAGVVKIHAGEPGHQLRRNSFGMGKSFRSNPRFEELDYFNPLDYVTAQDSDSPLFFNIITFPIITSDNDHIENYVFDGVIEPLTIRARASFFSIDVPFESHEVKGAVMNGNIDPHGASDEIRTVYVRDLLENIPFLDQYADSTPFIEEGLSLTGSYASSVVGYFQYSRSNNLAFNDSRYPRNTISTNSYDTDIHAALSLMSGSTDSYINTHLLERSATCGWDFENNIVIGTDSLAFGGLTY
jgi:hypothetical protein